MEQLLPPDPELELLHTRTYEVRSYRKDESTMMIRGAVRDVKPAGLMLEGDLEPLTIHHMIVEIDVTVPAMEIIRAEVVFEERPHTTCTGIVPHYANLVGLSIARGFTHKVRELFGGPRGCTHVTALLQAMAPIANQSRFSLMASSRRAAAAVNGTSGPAMAMPSIDQRLAMMASNINTCHVWDEAGDMVEGIRHGEEREAPLWIGKRLVKLGRDPESWNGPMA